MYHGFLKREILCAERRNRVIARRSHDLILQSFVRVDRLICTSGEELQSSGIEAVWGVYPGGVGYLHCSVPHISLFKTQHDYHMQENISKVHGSTKGIWSGNLTSGLPTEPHSNRAVQTRLSRFTWRHVLRIIINLA